MYEGGCRRVCVGGLGGRVLVIIVCCCAGFNSIPKFRDNIKARIATYFTNIHLIMNVSFTTRGFAVWVQQFASYGDGEGGNDYD